MTSWLAALEATGFAQALRNSVWSYPLVNAGHVLGVALLVGAIVPLDLRLLGAWRTLPLVPLWTVLTRTAAVGLALAVGCGGLLFATDATDYAASGLFRAKMTLVLLATLNALALRRTGFDPAGVHGAADQVPPRIRLAAAFSLAAWPTVLGLGRLVGYF